MRKLLLLALMFVAQKQLTITVYQGICDLSWNASTTPGAQYNLYRANNTGGPYTKILSNITGLAASDKPAPHATYYYVVRATVAAKESGNSNEVQAVIP